MNGKTNEAFVHEMNMADEDPLEAGLLKHENNGALYNILSSAKETVGEIGMSKTVLARIPSGEFHFFTKADQMRKGTTSNIELRCASLITVEGVPEESGEKTVFYLHGEKPWLYISGSDHFSLRNISFRFFPKKIEKNEIFELILPAKRECCQLHFSGCSHLSLQQVELDGISLLLEECRNIDLRNISGSGEILLKDCCGALSTKDVSCCVKVLPAGQERNHALYSVEKRDYLYSGDFEIFG